MTSFKQSYFTLIGARNSSHQFAKKTQSNNLNTIYKMPLFSEWSSFQSAEKKLYSTQFSRYVPSYFTHSTDKTATIMSSYDSPSVHRQSKAGAFQCYLDRKIDPSRCQGIKMHGEPRTNSSAIVTEHCIAPSVACSMHSLLIHMYY